MTATAAYGPFETELVSALCIAGRISGPKCAPSENLKYVRRRAKGPQAERRLKAQSMRTWHDDSVDALPPQFDPEHRFVTHRYQVKAQASRQIGGGLGGANRSFQTSQAPFLGYYTALTHKNIY